MTRRTSRCVRRLDSNPEVIVENCDTDKEGATQQSTTQHNEAELSSKRKSEYLMSDGCSESGWIHRDEGDEPLFSQSQHHHNSLLSRTDETYSKNSFTEQEDPLQTQRSQESGILPAARRGLVSLRDLPHPSKLRRKAGTGTRRVRLIDKDQPVEQHIQQLKKKKATYFLKTSPQKNETSLRAETERTDLTVPEDSEVTDVTVSTPNPVPFPTLPSRPEDVGSDTEVASVPPVAIPLTADEDDCWYKTHWKSQPLRPNSGSRKLEE
ncbi:hypothetical protein V1264_001973 [Littorina saxatilis]|uniref:Uncharacterized protein n=1 Tax=Littorina saxatilis TaxID=31220 RepID=A0AAN9C2F5_9CAEN